jgi:hypothetical protein
MKSTYKKPYPVIFKIDGKRYRSLYGRWIECESKGVYLSGSDRRNVVKFK